MPVLFIILLFLVSVIPEIVNPFLYGDAATRFAGAPALTGFNPYREWLPYTQLWNIIVYTLKLHFAWLYAFSIIHTCVFLYYASRIFDEYISKNRFDRIVFCIILLLFLSVGVVHSMTFQPYQEMPYLSIITAIIFFTLKGAFPWPLWILGMITREQFWIFWFSWLVVVISQNHWKFLKHPATIFITGIPLIWSFSTGHSTVPIPNNTFDTNIVILFEREKALFKQIWSFGLSTLIGWVLVTLTMMLISIKKLRSRFVPIFVAAIISLSVTHAYYLTTNLYTVTPDNPRPLFTFLVFVPFVAALFLSMHISRGKMLWMCVLVVVLLGHAYNFTWHPLSQHPFYSQAEQLSENARRDNQVLCFEDLDHWNEYMRYIVGAFRYSTTKEIRSGQSREGCTILLKPDTVSGEGQLILPNSSILQISITTLRTQ